VIPPPPVGHYIPPWDDWVEKTYAVDTPVRLLKPVAFFTKVGDDLEEMILPAGTVARVRRLYRSSRDLGLETTVATPLLFGAHQEKWWADVDYEVAHTTLRPLVDNWGPQTVPLKRSWKGRHTTPNPVPPAPLLSGTTLASAAYGNWVQHTYAPGTRVKFSAAVESLAGTIPAGARGVVDHVTTDFDKTHGYTIYQMVYVRLVDARDRWGQLIPALVGHVAEIDSLYFPALHEDMSTTIVPLDDNWIAATPSKRTSLSTSQRSASMKHRRVAPNKRTSRKKRRTSRKKGRIRS
jgi:hypothetical protein